MKKKFFGTCASALVLGSLVAPTMAAADTVKVEKGDTLWSIARENRTTVSNLKQLNKLSSDNIKVGQTLQVSSTSSVSVLERKEVNTAINDPLNMRKGPSVNYGIITKLSRGTVVNVLKYEGNWAKIQYNGLTGYVSKNYLKNVTQTSTPVNTSQKTYIVKHGDYLDKIAKMYGVTYKELAQWNNLSTYALKTGQVLVVSKPTTTTTVTQPTQPTQPVTSYSTYSVKSGDTLYGISKQFKLSVDELKRINNLTSNTIRVGQVLKVVGGQESPTSIFIRPAEGRVTSEQGTRINPISGSKEVHAGIDIAQAGTVSVKAAADGVVSRSYLSSSYGNVVFVVHTINGKTYETVYAHMRDRAVGVGAKVSQGQHLGYMGNTGNSTGQHLHFEIHEGHWNLEKSNAVDPRNYIKF